MFLSDCAMAEGSAVPWYKFNYDCIFCSNWIFSCTWIAQHSQSVSLGYHIAVKVAQNSVMWLLCGWNLNVTILLSGKWTGRCSYSVYYQNKFTLLTFQSSPISSHFNSIFHCQMTSQKIFVPSLRSRPILTIPSQLLESSKIRSCSALLFLNVMSACLWYPNIVSPSLSQSLTQCECY